MFGVVSSIPSAITKCKRLVLLKITYQNVKFLESQQLNFSLKSVLGKYSDKMGFFPNSVLKS